MAKLANGLRSYFFNRTILAACTFMTSQYCNDFEPKVILDTLRKDLAARVIEVSVQNESYGHLDQETGNLAGFLGRVQNGEYDVALTHVGILYERSMALGYTRPYVIEAVRFAVRQGGLQSISHALIKPFKFDLWISLLIAALVCTACIVHTARKERINISLVAIALLLWEVYLQKAAQIPVAFRKPFLFWGALTFVLAQWYSALLQSLLASPLRLPVISTLDQLAYALEERPDLRVCLHREGFAEYIVEGGATHLLQKLSHRLDSDAGSRSTLERCRERIRSDERDLVAIVEGPRVQAEADKIINDRSIEVSRDVFGIMLISAASSKRSPSLPYFDLLVSILLESGIFQRYLAHRDHFRVPTRNLPEGSEGAFVIVEIIAAFYGLAVVALLVETVCGRISQRRRTNSTGLKKSKVKVPKRTLFRRFPVKKEPSSLYNHHLANVSSRIDAVFYVQGVSHSSVGNRNRDVLCR